MKKISIEEYGKKMGLSRAEAYRKSRAGLIFLDKVKGYRGKVLYIWNEEKALKGLTPIKDDIRLELIQVNVLLSKMARDISVENGRVKGLLKKLLRPETIYNKRRIISNKRK